MHTFIRLLAAFATVMHLTCGCCLHAAHAGSPGHADHSAGCQSTATDQLPAAEACQCHDHAGAVPALAAAATEAAPDRGMASASETDHHDCRGCDCVADTSGSHATSSWQPFACGVTAPGDAQRIIAAARAGDRAADDGAAPVIPERHPLHERLLL